MYIVLQRRSRPSLRLKVRKCGQRSGQGGLAGQRKGSLSYVPAARPGSRENWTPVSPRPDRLVFARISSKPESSLVSHAHAVPQPFRQHRSQRPGEAGRGVAWKDGSAPAVQKDAREAQYTYLLALERLGRLRGGIKASSCWSDFPRSRPYPLPRRMPPYAPHSACGPVVRAG